ncbi:hypothetical protein WA026_015143 [Henosepilachna vigintioctopunctata]|uniref:CRESS-DNA virus Rep endonuclease domain-containing protein n=1 Tax=Henosepilachna vigintioctopunctata TaxID=420089 RepID=A0AAW1TMC2_9CUCU
MSNNKSRNLTTYIANMDKWEEKYQTHVSWYIGQEEEGERRRKHIQLMFGFNNPRTLAATQKLLQDANIQRVYDTMATLKYCTDENKRSGELYTFGEVPQFQQKKNPNLIQEALEMETYEEAMEHVEKSDTFYYISHQKQLQLYFTQKFDQSDKALYSQQKFTNKEGYKHLFNKTIIFIGPTGIGKTQYALAHFTNPLHVKDREDWGRYSPNQTDGIVLNDLDFKQWSPLTFLKNLDMETAITQQVKYCFIRIKAGTPKIICCNDEKLLWPTGMHPETKASCLRRVKIIHMHHKLWQYSKPSHDLTPEEKEAVEDAINDLRGEVEHIGETLPPRHNPQTSFLAYNICKENAPNNTQEEILRSNSCYEYISNRSPSPCSCTDGLHEQSQTPITEEDTTN